ncbi:hypothetical protein KC131_19160 [Pseudomonas sp. JQ170]|uniref:hypothetical protein n=1 Tax=unclassified Pseudomonas TaxID=196821 RepID=UPI0026521035|nr:MULTISPECIES: hypothetical protein [unclassified Pseudomonas]MDN7142772.1 hypothetical protein [Pseudomonas sp. JQ170]WRO77879.1 hypothetical protein U9R80_09485 [Pseudomonas sp. 170C]
MLTCRLLSSFALLACLNAQAVPTATLSPEQRHTLGRQLADSAGASQWQQLWQRSRLAGHLDSQPTTAYFTLPQALLPKAVSLTLSDPSETSAVNRTQVLYRREFRSQSIGSQADRTLNALCVLVDWRTLPAHALTRPAPYLGQISLLLARPC